MEEEILKPSAEWIKGCNWEILDPDGWDRKNFHYSFYKEEITKEEFEKRLLASTVRFYNPIGYTGNKTYKSND